MTESLAAALAAFQAELPRVEKGNTAKVKTEKASYSYRYADLAEISPIVLPLLAKHGLAWATYPTLKGDGRFVLVYELSHITGECKSGEYPLPDSKASPQVLGSAITYARRYALCAVTGVAPGGDDDDAAEAQHRHREYAQDVVQDAPPDADQPKATLRRMILRVGEGQGRSEDWITADFAQRTQGGDFGDASLPELQSYLKWLKQQPDADVPV